jgi:hypothetical protein
MIEVSDSFIYFGTDTIMRTIFTILIFAGLSLCQASAQNFHGYPCTQDCSGHEAGYQWADDQSITSTDDCSGNSNSFVEGCNAYVEENYPEDNEDEESSSDY